MIPHEGRLEVVVVPVSVHPLKGMDFEENSRQSIKKIVVDVQLCQISKKRRYVLSLNPCTSYIMKTYWQNAMVKGMDLF